MRSGTVPDVGNGVWRRSMSIVFSPLRKTCALTASTEAGTTTAGLVRVVSRTPAAAKARAGRLSAATGSSAHAGLARRHTTIAPTRITAAAATTTQPNPNTAASPPAMPSARSPTTAAQARATTTRPPRPEDVLVRIRIRVRRGHDQPAGQVQRDPDAREKSPQHEGEPDPADADPRPLRQAGTHAA